MKKVAIIGAKGFVGRHLAWYLIEKKGITPELYDIVEESGEQYYKRVNLLNDDEVGGVNLNVDVIFMMAGLTGTSIGFVKPKDFVNINEIALLNLLNAIKKSPYRPRIVFPSSRLVYKGTESPLTETDEKDAKTIYAANKIACEYFLKAYSANFDIPYTVFRICVPYGNVLDNNYSFGTIGFFIRMAESGKDITLYGGGNIKRTFTHIEDVCSQMVEGAFNEASVNEIFNIDGETSSLYEVASIIAKQYGVNVTSVPWPATDERLESGSTYFDGSKIRELLGGNVIKHHLADIVI